MILPDGRLVTNDAPEVNDVLSALVGRPVTLASTASSPKLEEYWPDTDGLAHKDTVTDEAIALLAPPEATRQVLLFGGNVVFISMLVGWLLSGVGRLAAGRPRDRSDLGEAPGGRPLADRPGHGIPDPDGRRTVTGILDQVLGRFARLVTFPD